MGRRFAEVEAWVAEDDAPWEGRNAVTLVPRSRAHKGSTDPPYTAYMVTTSTSVNLWFV